LVERARERAVELCRGDWTRDSRGGWASPGVLRDVGRVAPGHSGPGGQGADVSRSGGESDAGRVEGGVGRMRMRSSSLAIDISRDFHRARVFIDLGDARAARRRLEATGEDGDDSAMSCGW